MMTAVAALIPGRKAPLRKGGHSRFDKMMLRRQLSQWHKEQRVSLDKISRQQEELYKTLLQSHAEMRAIRRRRATNPDPLQRRPPPPPPVEEAPAYQAAPPSRLPSLGDPKVEEWLQGHTRDMELRRTNQGPEGAPRRRKATVDRLVIRRDAEKPHEKTTESAVTSAHTAAYADTALDLDQIVLEPASETVVEKKVDDQKHCERKSVINKPSERKPAVILAIKRTKKKQDNLVIDKKPKKCVNAQSSMSLNTSTILPPITEDHEETKSDIPVVEAHRPSTPAKPRVAPVVLLPVPDRVVIPVGQKGPPHPLKRQPQCTGKAWYGVSRSQAPIQSRQEPSLSIALSAIVAPSERSAEPQTTRSQPAPTGTLALTKVTRRKRRSEERHRRQVLDSESVVVYEQDKQGNIVPSVMEHHRRSFTLPTSREQRIRQRLLAAQERAALQQGTKMNAFIEQISEHVASERREAEQRLLERRKAEAEKMKKEEPSKLPSGSSNSLDAYAKAFSHRPAPSEGDPNSYSAIVHCRYIRTFHGQGGHSGVDST